MRRILSYGRSRSPHEPCSRSVQRTGRPVRPFLFRFLTGLLAPCCALPIIGAVPTFYADVLPILQNRCQECHREGEIGPMPLTTYKEVRPWAQAIRANVIARK